jgi:DNA polymerase
MYRQLLYDDIQKCDRCELSSSTINRKFGKMSGAGSDNAKVLMIGINPGSTRYYFAGIPFNAFLDELNIEGHYDAVPSVRAALESYFEIINLPKDDFYVTNVVKCSTKNNQFPENESIKSCFIWLQREIELIKPVVIVTLGSKVSELFRLKPLETRRQKGGVIVSLLHPAALVRGRKEQMLTAMIRNFELIRNYIEESEHE